MPSQISEAQSQILYEQIVPDFLAMLDGAPELEDPAEVEHLAAALLVPLEQPGSPPEIGFAVVEAIAARGDTVAAAVLAGLAVLAAEPLAAEARASAQGLTGEGVVSPAAAGVGTLAVQEAARIQSKGAELLVALLARPGAQNVQAAILGIEHHDTGGTLVECALTPPAALDEARQLLDGPNGTVTHQIGADELTDRVIAAARRAVEQETVLGGEAGLALPVVSRALTGDPAGLPRPALEAPWEQDDPELIVDAAADEEGFHQLMDQLLDEFEQHARASYPPDGVVWENGDFVASTMLQWKGGYDDGRLGRWTQADLAEYMLDYFPRKVSADDDTLAAVPECVRAFLGFLAVRGSLSGEPLEQLEDACEELRDEFLECASDGSNWGLAKSMLTDAGGRDRPERGRRARCVDRGLQRPPAPAARRDHRPRRGSHGPRRWAALGRRSTRSQAKGATPEGATPSAQAQPPRLTPPGCCRSSLSHSDVVGPRDFRCDELLDPGGRIAHPRLSDLDPTEKRRATGRPRHRVPVACEPAVFEMDSLCGTLPRCPPASGSHHSRDDWLRR
jgi:hypothetical protein